MQYTIKPRPTVYNGIHFRSRLEATWAAFFERLGWRWEYEHEEIAGWLPDFSTFLQNERRFLVEVKPELVFSPGSGVMKKIEKSRGDKPALLVSSPGIGCEFFTDTFIGLMHPCPYGADEWAGAYLGESAVGIQIMGIAHEPVFFQDEAIKRGFPWHEARRLWGAAKKVVRYEA